MEREIRKTIFAGKPLGKLRMWSSVLEGGNNYNVHSCENLRSLLREILRRPTRG